MITVAIYARKITDQIGIVDEARSRPILTAAIRQLATG